MSPVIENGDDASPQPITLQPNEPRTLWLAVCDLSEPGNYSGILRLSAQDKEPVSHSISFLVKESIWLAGLLICIGVVASHLLRLYTLVWRPRWDHRKRNRLLFDKLSELRAELKQKFGELDKDETDILDWYSTWLKDLDEALAQDQAEKPDAIIVEIDGKLNLLRLWLEIHRRIKSLPSSIRDSFQQNTDWQTVWQTVSVSLRTKRQPPDAAQAQAEATAQQIKLAELNRTITDKLKDYYQGQLDLLDGQVKAWLAQNNITIPEEEQLLASVKTARDKLDTDPPSFDLFPEALEQARANFVYYWARVLDEYLKKAPPKELPPGFDQTAWDTLKQEVRDDLKLVLAGGAPTDVIKAYERGYSRYLDGLITKLHAKVKKDQEELSKQLNDPKNDLKEQEENLAKAQPAEKPPIESEIKRLKDEIAGKTEGIKQLDSLVQKLVQARDQRLKGMLLEAEQTYNVVQEEYNNNISSDFKTLGPNEANAATAAGALPPGADDTVLTLPTLGRPQWTLPSVEGLRLLLQFGDWGRFILVTIAAVILGLTLLWVNDATWGGTADYLTAILWGLGLHQIAGAVFPGVGGLTQQLTGQPGS
jgi:hypothetical protein